jgi:protein-L-isoaspartate(D-aspartate) O-methyltransferase
VSGNGGAGRPLDDRERLARARLGMVRDQIQARGIRDESVLAAMERVPRDVFVPLRVVERAYEDGALSIGGGQTISQPYIVARMAAALRLSQWIEQHPGEPPVVLDVGTGSGYGAAVLTEIGARVVGIERDPELAESATRRLADLGYQVPVHVADGSAGWTNGAPYAGIVVAAATPQMPEPLVSQLADGARVVAPVGGRTQQDLVVVQRLGGGTVEERLEPCVFVPLIGRYGFSDA